MPKTPTSVQSETLRKNGRKSPGGKRTNPSNGRRGTPTQAACVRDRRPDARVGPIQRANAAKWFSYDQPQGPAAIHLTNECARASLLADRTENCRQAELENQGAEQERRWNRKRRRNVRYLGGKLNKSPEETRKQLEGFGCGLGFLEDCLRGAIVEIQDRGFLSPNVVDATVKLCGALPGPESIRANPMAYLIHIFNLGCTPVARAEEIKHWLEPSNVPRGSAIGRATRSPAAMPTSAGGGWWACCKGISTRSGAWTSASARRGPPEPRGGPRSSLDLDGRGGTARRPQPGGGPYDLPPSAQ